MRQYGININIYNIKYKIATDLLRTTFGKSRRHGITDVEVAFAPHSIRMYSVLLLFAAFDKHLTELGKLTHFYF
jgi:hypothetical protein